MTLEQLSVPVGVLKLTTAEQRPGEVFAVMLAGQVTLGAWPSTTVTVKLQVPVRPAASVALKVTELAPIGKLDPLGRPAVWVVETPAQLSVPDGVEKVTAAVHWPNDVFAEMFAGQVTVGA